MFCPLSLDYGNVADWFAAVASLAAVATALIIAFREANSLKKERLLQENAECQRMAHVKAEIIRIASEIEVRAVSAGSPLQELRLDAMAPYHEARLAIEGLRAQLSALQKYPISDPRLFGEIGRVIFESELTVEPMASSSSRQMFMRALADKMRQRREAIATI